MIRLAFRLDDPSASSNREIEARILAAMARHGFAVTFAVIPFRAGAAGEQPLTREQAGAMLAAVAAGRLDIALHGYAHRDANPGGKPSEFAGLPAARQRELIAAARDHLEALFGRRIGGFVPPWNSYDACTLTALEQLGFDHLSSDTHHAPTRPTTLRTLPLTCHLPRLRNAIAEARRFARLAPVITVVMHHYDFPGGSSPVFGHDDEFADLLAWVAAQDDVRVLSLSELAAELGVAASQRVFRHLRLRDRLPWRFRHWLPDLCCATRPLLLP